MTCHVTQNGVKHRHEEPCVCFSFLRISKNTLFFFGQVFVGNDDSKTIAVRHLKHPITARYVRIHPLAWYGVHICMRAELYGCDHLGQS